MSDVSSGFLSHGIPYMALGAGPPLVKVEGLTPTHDVPKGGMQRMYLSTAKPLSGHFRVYWVNRKKGLRPGESMSDIAGHLAAMIEEEFGEELTWTRRDDIRASRIYITTPRSIDDPADALDQHRAWLIDRVFRIREVFGPRVKLLDLG